MEPTTQTENISTPMVATQPEVITPADAVVKQKSSVLPKLLMILLVIILMGIAGALGYYSGKAMKESETPTPTPTPTPVVTLTPTVTETPTPTLTVTTTGSVTPTSITVSKTGRVKEYTNGYTLKFTLDVPSDVTVTETKVSSWNGIVLKKGTKNFMAFNLPYELYEMQGYTTVTDVVSSTITNLKRVKAKSVFTNSGTYSFAVAYVSPSSLSTGTECTDPVVTTATTSPCALPAVSYSSNIGFSAYCSVDAEYLAICDAVMKTIKVVKE